MDRKGKAEGYGGEVAMGCAGEEVGKLHTWE